MSNPGNGLNAIAEIIKGHAETRAIRMTLHAQTEMINDHATIAELLKALESCRVIENYPDHERGSCCLQ